MARNSAHEAEGHLDESLQQHTRPGAQVVERLGVPGQVADQRLLMLGLPARFGARNPFAFMELQDVQELTNFFERKVSAYQVAVQGEVSFDMAF